MEFKDVIASKIAKEKNTAKKIASATKNLEKKATVGFFANPETEEEKIAIDLAEEIDARAEYILHRAGLLERGWQTEEQWRERVNVVKEAIKPLVETKLKKYLDQPQVIDLVKEHLEDINSHATVWAIEEIINGKEQNLFNQANKRLNFDKKAAEEDLDVKLKVQKNKPAGLDTSSPKSLPESIRPLMQDLKGKISDVKEIETQLAARKAELDAKYQEAKNESKIVEKQAEIENLTNNIGKLLFAAKNETFQFQDNLVALTHQTKTVPAKATDKWKFEKVFAKLQELMGGENAQKFLDATLNGLQSQATEKTITELNIFSPTQKQMKTSDTSDTNSFIDALKEIYTNLRAYFLDVKKANNIIEEQLATGATASKKQNVSKKAESSYKDKIYDAIDMGGEKWVAEALVKWISEDDAERFCKIYELIDVESKKKVNMKKAKTNKKANISKKASVQLNLEIDDYIELLKDRYESAPADWKTRGGKLLINELYEYMENYDGGKVEIPSIVIDNFLINGDIVERTEFTADGEASNKFEKYNGNWEEFCEEEAVIYNDNAACTNLGF